VEIDVVCVAYLWWAHRARMNGQRALPVWIKPA